MKRRGFTLIEVLISLAIFALAAVTLGAAYSNVLLGRMALRQDEQALDDMARCRAALLETPGFDDVETGGDVHLPGGRKASWKGKIEPTAVSDLFAVELTVTIEASPGTEPGAERSEARMLLRPTWSIPSDRQKIRDDARQRLEKERGYTEANGNSSFVSTPTRGKTLIPQNGRGNKGDKGGATGNNSGKGGNKGGKGGATGAPPNSPSGNGGGGQNGTPPAPAPKQ